MTVLDIGSGRGGPARKIAHSSGNTVVGVDVTAAYVDTARAFTRPACLDNTSASGTATSPTSTATTSTPCAGMARSLEADEIHQVVT